MTQDFWLNEAGFDRAPGWLQKPDLEVDWSHHLAIPKRDESGLLGRRAAVGRQRIDADRVERDENAGQLRQLTRLVGVPTGQAPQTHEQGQKDRDAAVDRWLHAWTCWSEFGR